MPPVFQERESQRARRKDSYFLPRAFAKLMMTFEALLAQLHLLRELILNGITLLYFGHSRQWRFPLLYELEVKQAHR